MLVRIFGLLGVGTVPLGLLEQVHEDLERFGRFPLFLFHPRVS